MGRGGLAVRVAVAALLLAACGTGVGAAAKTWVPKPSFQGEGAVPGLSPQPQPRASDGSPGSSNPVPPPTSSAAAAKDPNVVATHLTAPDAIAVLPDNTALVAERTTGRIVRVQPLPDQPVVTVRTLTGLDTAGGGGLLDLALSPNFVQDSLVFALITTPTDTRVVDFTLNGPVTAVLTGIPKGASDNTGRIVFGDDGRLYVGTSDAGTATFAADPSSLAGKVLRVTDIGTPAATNPNPASPVFTRGHHLVSGLCLIPGTNQLIEIEPNSTGGTEVNLLVAGADYGWPARTSSSRAPISTLPAHQTAPGSCSVQGGTLYIASRDGRDLLSAPLTHRGNSVSVGTYTAAVVHQYGRLNTVVSAADGALWLTTSNKDGFGKPVADDERVIRIMLGGGASNSPV